MHRQRACRGPAGETRAVNALDVQKIGPHARVPQSCAHEQQAAPSFAPYTEHIARAPTRASSAQGHRAVRLSAEVHEQPKQYNALPSCGTPSDVHPLLESPVPAAIPAASPALLAATWSPPVEIWAGKRARACWSISLDTNNSLPNIVHWAVPVNNN